MTKEEANVAAFFKFARFAERCSGSDASMTPASQSV